MKKLLLILCIFSGYANAEPEAWECSGRSKDTIKLTGDFANGLGGTIVSNGLSQDTGLMVTGLERGWYFGGVHKKTKKYNYAFKIDPNNTGGYYNFSTGKMIAEASAIFICRKLL
jgi:hypothetical protein